jgi:phosphotransferase system HPr (HPr) family protein
MKTDVTRRAGNLERESGGIRLRLRCRQGVRIREAFQLTRLARACKASMTIFHEGFAADAQDLMEILRLGIPSNEVIEVRVTGVETERALAGLESLVEAGLPPMFTRAEHSAAAGAGRWAPAPDG